MLIVDRLSGLGIHIASIDAIARCPVQRAEADALAFVSRWRERYRIRHQRPGR